MLMAPERTGGRGLGLVAINSAELTSPGVVLPLGFWITADDNLPVVYTILSALFVIRTKSTEHSCKRPGML